MVLKSNISLSRQIKNQKLEHKSCKALSRFLILYERSFSWKHSSRTELSNYSIFPTTRQQGRSCLGIRQFRTYAIQCSRLRLNGKTTSVAVRTVVPTFTFRNQEIRFFFVIFHGINFETNHNIYVYN